MKRPFFWAGIGFYAERRRYGREFMTWVYFKRLDGEYECLGDPWPCVNPKGAEVLAAYRALKPYVGCKGLARQVFFSAIEPTPQSCPDFSAVVGPFETEAGAFYAARHGLNNPHIQCVEDAERLAHAAS